MMHPDPLQFDLDGVRVARVARKSPADDLFRGLAVAPFTIVCDSREQLPYEFSSMLDNGGHPLVVPTVVKGLASGDYSIQGMEDKIAVERKSMDDCFSSMTWGRARFEAELARLSEMQAAFVMIEATWPEIMDPAGHRPGWINQTEPRSVEGTIVSWSLRYGVHFWLAGDRRGAEQRTFSILRKFWDDKQKELTP